MRRIGVFIQEEQIKIAVMIKKNHQLIIKSLDTIPKLSFSWGNQNDFFITALPAEKVIRKELHLKLNKKQSILKTLPFQLESQLPFQSSDALIYPFFYPKKNGTDVVIFATARSYLEQHIQEMQTYNINPDQISCIPCALSNFAQWVFPQEKCLSLIHENTGIVIEQGKIVFSQTIDDADRLTFSIQKRFEDSFQIGLVGPLIQDYPFEILRNYAIPIGLALEAFINNSCQFRQDFFIHPKVEKKKNYLNKIYFIALSLLPFIAWFGGTLILNQKENRIKQKISKYFHNRSDSIEKQITLWGKQLQADSKEFPLLPDTPSVSETLAWLGSIQEGVNITRFHYELVQYPQISCPSEPYTIKIDLEFNVENRNKISRFQEILEKDPTLIDKKQKILWNINQEPYKVSFWLRKNVIK